MATHRFTFIVKLLWFIVNIPLSAVFVGRPVNRLMLGGHQLFPALEDFRMDRLPIDLGLESLWKHFPFFLLHVMLDELAQQGEFGSKGVLTRLKLLEFSNQHMYEMMLFDGFIHELVVVDGFSNRGIDERFF